MSFLTNRKQEVHPKFIKKKKSNLMSLLKKPYMNQLNTPHRINLVVRITKMTTWKKKPEEVQ